MTKARTSRLFSIWEVRAFLIHEKFSYLYFHCFLGLLLSFGCFYGVYVFARQNLSYTFYPDRPEFLFEVRNRHGHFKHTFEYKHVDIRVVNQTSGTHYMLIFFVKRDEPGIWCKYINYWLTPWFPRKVKDYCIDVLKRTPNNEEPKESLEELTSKSMNVMGTLSGAISGVIRALR